MAQMIVIYKPPKEPAAFERHYFEIHVPLAKQLPGLKRYETSNGSIISLAGAPHAYFAAILYFDSIAAIKDAFAGECGRACAADRRVLVPDEPYMPECAQVISGLVEPYGAGVGG
jgi:uncharacterized protein (TIGR02118 family)